MTNILRRFEKHFIPEPNSGCWIWTGGICEKRYGRFNVDGKNMRANRVSWMLYRGIIPESKLVCHKCDTPECVNPDHLFIGTAADNNLDMARKGRLNTEKMRFLGEMHANSKLTQDRVIYIRTCEIPHGVLAKKFGVSEAIIRQVRARKVWRHI